MYAADPKVLSWSKALVVRGGHTEGWGWICGGRFLDV
jgi:hypothetical protein